LHSDENEQSKLSKEIVLNAAVATTKAKKCNVRWGQRADQFKHCGIAFRELRKLNEIWDVTISNTILLFKRGAMNMT
jgi:hypothetical protein